VADSQAGDAPHLLPISDMIFSVQQTVPKDDKGWADIANASVALGDSSL
jgi:hypothetical protein